MSDRENSLIDQRHQEVLGAIQGVHERLDTLNGRTRTLENKVSVLSYAYAVGTAVVSFLTYKINGSSQ